MYHYLVFIALLFLITILLLWYLESRLFLFVFQKIFFYSKKTQALLSDKTYLFPQHILLESNWEVIYHELVQLMKEEKRIPRFHEVDKANHKISYSEGPAWRTFLLKAFGGWFEQNCARLPQTTALLEKCPSVCSAMISILEPGVHIPEHTGKLHGIYRYHLALIVPKSTDCYLKLAGETIHWKQGEGILFDDTFKHSVINTTDEYRVILFLNVKKRMSPFGQMTNNFLLKIIEWSPIYKKAMKTGVLKID